MAQAKKKSKTLKKKSGTKKGSAATLSFSTLAGKAAYDALLSQAKALGAPPVSRVPPAIAAANVRTTCKALASHLKSASKIAPGVDAKLLAALPAIASAFDYAAKRIPKEASDGAIARALAVVAPLRDATLHALDAAVFCGLVDAGRVLAIHQGTGKLDMANDAVAIAGVFAEYAGTLGGKHPFTGEQIETLRAQGAFLQGVLKPGGAPREKKARGPEATIKDQFGALLAKAYGQAEQLGAAVFGARAFHAHVPPLQSIERRAKKKTPAAPVAPTPSAPPA